MNQMSEHSTTILPNELPSEAVIRTIAAIEDIDPLDIEPPLYDAVDHDALDSLLKHGRNQGSSLSVTFSYCGYSIRIDTDDTLAIGEK